MVETFAALSEPNRLRIVELLRHGPRSVGEIVLDLDLAQPQVSKHLKVLRDVGLVEVEARAQQRHYGLRGAPLRDLWRWLDDYRRLWDERFDGVDAVIEELHRAQHTSKATSKKKKRKP